MKIYSIKEIVQATNNIYNSQSEASIIKKNTKKKNKIII